MRVTRPVLVDGADGPRANLDLDTAASPARSRQLTNQRFAARDLDHLSLDCL
jgi:hypothetical protein